MSDSCYLTLDSSYLPWLCWDMVMPYSCSLVWLYWDTIMLDSSYLTPCNLMDYLAKISCGIPLRIPNRWQISNWIYIIFSLWPWHSILRSYLKWTMAARTFVSKITYRFTGTLICKEVFFFICSLGGYAHICRKLGFKSSHVNDKSSHRW